MKLKAGFIFVNIFLCIFFYFSHAFASSTCDGILNEDIALQFGSLNPRLPLPDGLISPVDGFIRFSSSNQTESWAFWQWGNESLYGNCGLPNTHCVDRNGLGKVSLFGTNDKYAYDINLAGDKDRGKPVYPIAPGTIVGWFGVQKSSSTGYYSAVTNYNPYKYGAVLVEHTTPILHPPFVPGPRDGEKYYSVYMHMNPVNVAIGDQVTSGTVLGYISKKGAYGVNHLHFAV